jgi:hypothetical protein
MTLTIQFQGPDIQLPDALDSVAVKVKTYFDSHKFAFRVPYGSVHFSTLPFLSAADVADDRIKTTSGALFAGCSGGEFDRAMKELGFAQSGKGKVWKLEWQNRKFQASYDEDHPGSWTIWEDTDSYLHRVVCC